MLNFLRFRNLDGVYLEGEINGTGQITQRPAARLFRCQGLSYDGHRANESEQDPKRKIQADLQRDRKHNQSFYGQRR